MTGFVAVAGFDDYERDFAIPVEQPLSAVLPAPSSFLGAEIGEGLGAFSLQAFVDGSSLEESHPPRIELALTGDLLQVDAEFVSPASGPSCSGHRITGARVHAGHDGSFKHSLRRNAKYQVADACQLPLRAHGTGGRVIANELSRFSGEEN
ncbi:MAG: hypothetical protein V6Z81_05325 [Parvularculales bacterium]